MSEELRPSTFDAIIEAGFRVLGQNPAASLADIAATAGVGRATLHRHFKGRGELIRALALSAAKELESAADNAARRAVSNTDALKRIMQAIVPLGARHMFLLSGAAEQYPDVQAELDRQDAELMSVIEAARKEGLYTSSCPAAWVKQSFDMLVYGAWQMVFQQQATPQQASNLAWTTFKAGLKKAKM